MLCSHSVLDGPRNLRPFVEADGVEQLGIYDRTITYDQIQMQIRNTAGTTLATVLNVCSNTGAWTQASFNTTPYAGQTVVLWFTDHHDGYPTDPTYFLLDDVSLSGS